MTLREALQQIESLDQDSTLFRRVDEPLSLDSTVTIGQLPEDDDPSTAAPPGMGLFMDIWHVAETMEGLRQMLRDQLGRQPNQQELLERFMAYLKNDA